MVSGAGEWALIMYTAGSKSADATRMAAFLSGERGTLMRAGTDGACSGAGEGTVWWMMRVCGRGCCAGLRGNVLSQTDVGGMGPGAAGGTGGGAARGISMRAGAGSGFGASRTGSVVGTIGSGLVDFGVKTVP